MSLQMLDNDTLLNVMASSAQAECSQLANVNPGSALRAIFQANASVALWVQWLIGRVLLAARAATSVGDDLDSWVADYGLSRLPAVAAHGTVTLMRTDVTNTIMVQVGSMVRTGDGTQSFLVAVASEEASWNSLQAAYELPAGISSIDVPVVAVTAGTGGNVQPATVTLLGSAIPGIDRVSNAAAMSGGLNQETDDSLRQRAKAYFSSLSRATTESVLAAANGVQQNLSVIVRENIPQPGQFVVIVDDGSGHPPDVLLQSVYAAVDTVRPIGTAFTVQAPVVRQAPVSVVLTIGDLNDRSDLINRITAAVTAMINTLPIGMTLPVTRISSIAYAQSASVLNAVATVNGTVADLVPQANEVVRAVQVVVS